MNTLETFKAIVDDAFRDAPFKLKQNKAASILSEAYIHLSQKDFQELEKYVFEKLK